MCFLLLFFVGGGVLVFVVWGEVFLLLLSLHLCFACLDGFVFFRLFLIL